MSTSEIRKATKKIDRARARIEELSEARLDAVVAALRVGESMTGCATACGMARQSLRQQLEERRPEFVAELSATAT